MQIDYPLSVSSQGRTATTDEQEHVRDMIEQLLFTTPGERVNRPDFGCGLLRMVFEPTSPEIAAALQFTTQAALQRWLGDVIEAQAVEITSEDSKLRVTVQYLVRSTSERRRDTFVTGGGP